MDQAEKLRNVVKLKNQVYKPNARVITVTSGKGGVGKSNVAVNLAVQMQKLGKKVIVFDADFGLANVEVMFGAVPQYHLGDVIYHGKNIADIITEGPLGIGFVSGGTGVAGLNDLTKEQVISLTKSLQALDRKADVILIDTGAGISSHVLEFVLVSPEVLLVTTADPSALTDAYSLLKAAYRDPRFQRQETKISVLVNRAGSEDEGRMVFEKLSSVVGQFLEGELCYAGSIPQDRMLERAVRQQKTVSLDAPAAKSSRAFEALTASILDMDVRQTTYATGIAQLFSRFWKQTD